MFVGNVNWHVIWVWTGLEIRAWYNQLSLLLLLIYAYSIFTINAMIKRSKPGWKIPNKCAYEYYNMHLLNTRASFTNVV